ncbi:MAG: hypothetical protein WA865_02660 [Spirulinaceae cyanobacterium]
MTLQELQKQALQLSIGNRWRLVQSLLGSIKQETLLFGSPNLNMNLVTGLVPWTQGLIGTIWLSPEELTKSYIAK